MHIVIILAAFLASAPLVQEEDLVTEPRTKTTFARTLGEDPQMELIGLACRTRYFVKVYSLGLYAEKDRIIEALGDNPAESDAVAKAVIETAAERAIILKFVRDVGGDRIKDAFRGGIEMTIKIDDPLIAEDAQLFLDGITDAKKEDVAEILFGADGAIILTANGQELARVQNQVLAKALLSTFLGEKPVDEKIKRDLVQFFKP